MQGNALLQELLLTGLEETARRMIAHPREATQGSVMRIDPHAQRIADYQLHLARSFLRMTENVRELMMPAPLSAQCEIISAESLFYDCLQEFSSWVLLEGRHIIHECALGTPQVECDRAQLVKALIGLVEDAARYGPAGQPLSLWAGEMHYARRAGPAVALMVSDTRLHAPRIDEFEQLQLPELLRRPGWESMLKPRLISLLFAHKAASGHRGEARFRVASGSGLSVLLLLPVAAKPQAANKNEEHF